MNFLLCLNDDYIDYAVTLIYSIIKNGDIDNISFYILTDWFSEKSLTKIKKFKSENIKIYIYKRSLEDFSHFKESFHFNKYIYLRLLVWTIKFPKNLIYIMYLDIDMLCIGKIVVGHINKCNILWAALEKKIPIIEQQKKKLNISNYFNSGMLYINIKGWTENDILSKVLDIMHKKSKYMIFPDQDALNVVFNNNYTILSNKLNYTTNYFNDNNSNENISIIHFTWSIKPWHWNYYSSFGVLYIFYYIKATSNYSFIFLLPIRIILMLMRNIKIKILWN